MRYCARCIIPDTRPGIRFGPDGVCSACVAHEERARVDWPARRAAFESLVAEVKGRHGRYDCVIPVSGGKDSTWQLATCLGFGLHPLAVSWKPPARTELGERNLATLVRMGVDHMDVQVNPRVEKKFLYQALVRYGMTGIPMHLAIFNIPLTLAVAFDIPLVVWGENSADEYIGADDPHRGHRLDAAWVRRHGVTQGTTARDWVSHELTTQELTLYFGPADEALAARDIRAVFLGHYLRWDPALSVEIARAHGFEASAEGPRTGYYDYADLDDEFISIHHYLKWYKFGFTRAFDNLSLEIRNGRMSREEAIRCLRAQGPDVPRQDIERFCEFTEISMPHFFSVIERFRNPRIWIRCQDRWMIKGFLIPDWEWADAVHAG